jgi:hypothetical protein
MVIGNVAGDPAGPGGAVAGTLGLLSVGEAGRVPSLGTKA